MPRIYLPDRQIHTPLKAATRETRRIPPTAKLLDIKDASAALTEQFGKGFSQRSIRRWVINGDWEKGWHYVRRGSIIKIYIAAVQEWVVSGGCQ